jgi:hypothetical protein
MTGLSRFLLCLVFLAVCSPFALADQLVVTGFVSFNQNSLSFAPPFATQADTGIFSSYSNGTVGYFLGTVPYTNGFPQTEEAFMINGSDGNTLTFYAQVNNPTQTIGADGNLDVTLDETGYYVINGGSPIAGTFDLSFNGTSPTGSTTNVMFTGTGSFTDAITTGVAPEPGSFLLMGTGFLALAGLVRSRRGVVS